MDIGAGTNPREGFESVDRLPFGGKVKHVVELAEIDYDRVGKYKPWPWLDNSVEEFHASHVIEHFDSWERVHVVNEMHRCLIPGGKVTIIVPHWSSCRAYGDPTHKWPPCGEFWPYYLSREWRLGNAEKGIGANAPHTDVTNEPRGFSCDFEVVWGYGMNPALLVKSQDVQQYATQWHREAIQDMHLTLTSRK